VVGDAVGTVFQENRHVRLGAQKFLLQVVTKACGYCKRDDQCRHACDHTKNGNESDQGNDSLLALGSEVSNGNHEFEFHKNIRAIRGSYSGLRCGKRITSRIEVELVNNIVSRSMPIPSPAVGGMP